MNGSNGHHRGRRFRNCPPLILSLVAIAGCDANADPVGELSGSVTCNGRKVTYGAVLFFAADAKENDSAIAKGVIENGEYKAGRVPVGPVKIVVLSHPKVPVGMPDPRQKPSPPRNDYVPIPEKYNHLGTTDLTHTVAKGSHTYNIKLPP